MARKAQTTTTIKNIKQAKSLYIQAIKEDPMEYSYLENLGATFYQLQEYGNSMLILQSNRKL